MEKLARCQYFDPELVSGLEVLRVERNEERYVGSDCGLKNVVIVRICRMSTPEVIHSVAVRLFHERTYECKRFPASPSGNIAVSQEGFLVFKDKWYRHVDLDGVLPNQVQHVPGGTLLAPDAGHKNVGVKDSGRAHSGRLLCESDTVAHVHSS